MHAKIHTIAFRGIETIAVTIQIHIANGLPAMAIVGLADKAVAESRERVRVALASIGLALPPKRIAVQPMCQKKGRISIYRLPSA